MKAVHFGAGKIGRGFIAELLHDTGYEITFIDVFDGVIDELNQYHNYYLYVIDQDYKRKEIDHVSGINSIKDPEAVTKAIVDADLITTAVIADNFPKIAANLANGLKARLDAGKEKINVIPCENANYCGKMLEKELLKTGIITEEELNKIAAIPSQAVDRVVFGCERDGRNGIEIGSTYELVVEKNKLVNPDEEPIKGAHYTDNLDKFLERKLCVVNGGHTMIAYLANVEGYEIIQDYFKDEKNVDTLRNIMLQAASFLEDKYGFTHEEMVEYIDGTIGRWTMPGIRDTVERIAKAPIRKLAPGDRMTKSALECEKRNLPHDLILKGMAAAFLYKKDNDPQAVEVQEFVKENGIEAAITKYTGIEAGTKIHEEIVKNYKELSGGKKTMKLQLALDEMKLDAALELAKKVEDYIDIIEIGTPFCLDAGNNAVETFKKVFPDKEILADCKIMDGGYFEAENAIKAGADYVTVCAVADLLTVKGIYHATQDYGKKTVVDMITVTDIPEKVAQLEEVGVDVIAVHTGADMQAAGREPIEDLEVMVKCAKKAEIAVAGGINSKTIDKYVALKPDIVIVGSAIGNAKDPVAEAKAIKEAMK